MSTKEAVTIVCRALAIYFLAWLLYDLTYLPSAVHPFLHYQARLGSLSDSAYNAYMYSSYRLSLSFLVLRMLVLFFAVQWFYRAGPRLHVYFLAPSEAGEPARAN